MYEDFVNSFMIKMNNNFDANELQLIKSELSVYIQDYDITKKETELEVYHKPLPDCYKIYMVTRKIEGLSQKSLDLYKLYIEDFLYAMNKPLENITTNDIRVYLYNVQQQRGICNSTLDDRRIIINGFMEWICNEDYIPRNPCRNIKAIKYSKEEEKALTLEQLEVVRNGCKNIRERAIIEFLYSTGCRVTELTELDIAKVNMDKREVHIHGKGDKYRTSYISPKCYILLKQYLMQRTDNNKALFVVNKRPYSRITKSGIEQLIKAIGKRPEVNIKLHPHLFRKTMATECLRRGMPVQEIQKILGHSNINTTMIYAQSNMDDIKHDHMKYVS